MAELGFLTFLALTDIAVGELTETMFVWREPNRERFSHPNPKVLKINYFRLLTNASLQVRCIFYLH